MDFIEQIAAYQPINGQEAQDRAVILDLVAQYPHNILLRENQVAHITSSGFIMNEQLDKVLLIHHNIRNAWAWTGGHADGNPELLDVAIKEAKEETGIVNVRPLFEGIASLDILPVYGHMKKEQYINVHLHLSIAYLLITGEEEVLKAKADENSGVKWFDVASFSTDLFDHHDQYLYGKLIKKARQWKNIF